MSTGVNLLALNFTEYWWGYWKGAWCELCCKWTPTQPTTRTLFRLITNGGNFWQHVIVSFNREIFMFERETCSDQAWFYPIKSKFWTILSSSNCSAGLRYLVHTDDQSHPVSRPPDQKRTRNSKVKSPNFPFYKTSITKLMCNVWTLMYRPLEFIISKAGQLYFRSQNYDDLLNCSPLSHHLNIYKIYAK